MPVLSLGAVFTFGKLERLKLEVSLFLYYCLLSQIISTSVRKQWQRRYCVVKDGLFTLAHNQVCWSFFSWFVSVFELLMSLPERCGNTIRFLYFSSIFFFGLVLNIWSLKSRKNLLCSSKDKCKYIIYWSRLWQIQEARLVLIVLQILILAKCPKHDLKFADMSSEGKTFFMFTGC